MCRFWQENSERDQQLKDRGGQTQTVLAAEGIAKNFGIGKPTNYASQGNQRSTTSTGTGGKGPFGFAIR